MSTREHRIRAGARLLPVFLCGLLLASLARANPAMNLERTLVQPDGTPVPARLWGDEFANGWETADGYTLRHDAATGWWTYAVRDASGALVESSARAGLDAPTAAQHLRPDGDWLKTRRLELGDRTLPGDPAAKAAPAWASGTTQMLIIVVQFPADGADADGPQPAVPTTFSTAQIQANMFGGTSTGPGNLTDYYDEVSFGALDLVGTVVGPYTLANDKDDYDDGPLSAKDMVAEAIALADGDVDYNDFDNDNDGWVDNVAVMYAGNGPDNGGYDGADPDANSLWPHASSLGAPVAVDGINAQTYFIAAELLNNSRLRTIGVYAHEFGHKLGLPDLYDTDDAPNDSDGIGHWCLMASGSWCSNVPGSENGEAPSHMSAWCKQYLGWVTPTDLTGANTAQVLPEAATNAFAVQLGTNPGGPDDWPGGSGEYFLVENRQRTGFDVGLDGCGLLVWHIDEAMNHNRTQGHTAAAHRLVDLEEADGLDELDGSGTRGDTGDPFPGSTGNDLWNDTSYPHSQLYDGTATGFRMKVLDTCGAEMTATFGNTPPVAACQDVQVDADGDCLGAVTAAMVDAGSSDPDGDAITLALDPAGPYPLGTTEVELVVTDEKGESATCTATVTVVDATPPVIACPTDIQVECAAAGGTPAADAAIAAFLAAVSATDNCDDDVEITHDAPAFFAGPCDGGGVTVVTFTATDDAGNTSQCSASVTVVDTTPPELEVTVAPQVLWPPNHKLVEVTYTVTTSDVCDPSPTWQLVSLTSNEPDDGLGDGDTENDIQGAALGTADAVVDLRAERSGTGSGRVYTAVFRAADCAGNATDVAVKVHVPHAKSDIASLTSASAMTVLPAEVVYLVPGAALWPKGVPVTGDERQDGLLDTIRPRTAFAVNTAGTVPTTAFYVADVDEDRIGDALLAFDRRALEALDAVSATEDGAPVLALGIGPEQYLVLDMALAEPTPLDLGATIAAYRAADGERPDAPDDPEPGDRVVPRLTTAITAVAPNPFNPRTELSFSLAADGPVQVDVFDLSGRRVARLLDGSLPAGEHAVAWLGRDDQGRRAASGVYFFRLRAGGQDDIRRAMLVK